MDTRSKFDILGIKIDDFSKKETLEKIKIFLSEPKFHQIATINPEFIMEAQKNQEFRNILNSCDLNIADGMGIKFAFWRYGRHLKCRIAGADLMEKIIRLANKEKLSIFLAAKKDGLSTWEETRNAIAKFYPNLIVDGDDIDTKDSAYQIMSSSCQIVFCNFGAPYQETFIARQNNDRIRLAMGVGGSFDFLTGYVRRAPCFWRLMGLEWLWRLILQPKRLKRIWNAVVVFPIKIILNR
ncbi:MAG TPA: WecB/TagA/CpsF family glycosyltransferase [Candidatus Moranbacteria bacterium]|nr:WecB/TagA/CpsF family glycosyltransferase [Candidatus Moranbacteria bacterium]